jgi:uncharacterized protein (DUF433 family)
MAIAADFEASVSEAAYIANISARDVNRVVDEDIIPRELFVIEEGRRFNALACALASFYFKEEDLLTKVARQRVIFLFTERCKSFENYAKFLSLSVPIRNTEWEVDLKTFKVELGEYASQVKQRMRLLAEAESMVSLNQDVLAGEPVFNGTRVPVRTIAAWLEADISSEKIKESYPSVTDNMLRIAPIYVETNPRRGRPAKFGEINPAWKLKSSSTVKLKKS